MKEDLLRHALTASLAALLASAGTALLLVDRPPARATPPTSAMASRDDGASDERLVEALGRVESALSGLQMSVEQAASQPRREVAVAAPAPSAESGGDRPREGGPASAEDGADPVEEEARARAPGVARPVDVAAVESLLARFDSYGGRGVKEPDLNPARSYYLRPVSEIARELGPPTESRGTDAGFRAWWNVPSGRYLSMEFVDGICVELHHR